MLIILLAHSLLLCHKVRLLALACCVSLTDILYSIQCSMSGVSLAVGADVYILMQCSSFIVELPITLYFSGHVSETSLILSVFGALVALSHCYWSRLESCHEIT